MNRLHGSFADGQIIPVKVHRAKQPYDPVHKLLIQPYVYSPEKGHGAYWTDFDWKQASQKGQQQLGLPFSGQVAFARTEMYWPINHMVSPKEQAVGCAECHTRQDGRLASLPGFYMPGRDTTAGLDLFGQWLLLLSAAGIGGHAFLRWFTRGRRHTSHHA